MTTEITMPRLSETMADGKILSWHKKVNDRVEKGDVIAEVETDKANMEIEAVDSGILSEILISEGQIAKVGDPIALLDGKSKKEQLEEPKPVEIKEEPEEETEEELPEFEHKTEKTEGIYKGINASPLAKKLAEKMNVDLSMVKGTGPGGRIRENDFHEYLKGLKKQSEEGKIKPLSRMRQTIASRMKESKKNIPHFYATYEVNADKLISYYNKFVENNEDITYNDIFIKAVASVLRKHAICNSSFKGDHIEIKENINIGIAFATEGGLLVPVIHDCDKKTLKEISVATKTIKDRVKNNKLKPEDMSGGTFTISNMGMYGVKEFVVIINPPEAAGLAIGSIQKIPIVKDDQIVIGNVMNITLSADHRVVDGATVALFLKDLKDILENPEKIL
ncbi:MAG: dihydrolipoamide acetyltransferase family protein [Candidatus Gastranaerophilales bacterium]|nr:dihydrolipoamide acetyltransferase family protein [Candidatus Gastranaerophilales bacterium]